MQEDKIKLLNSAEFVQAMSAWSFCELINDNCKELEEMKKRGLFEDMYIISSNLDKGAFQLKEAGEGKYVLVFGADGTTSAPEWISNFTIRTKDGMHKGWCLHGDLLYYDMRWRLEHLGVEMKDILAFVGRGHSRGGPLALRMAEKIFEETGIKPTVATFGAPAPYTIDGLEKRIEEFPYYHTAYVNKYDFVDNIQLPKWAGKVFKRFYRKHQLYHCRQRLFLLPNGKGFDHLNYGSSITRAHELWEVSGDVQTLTRE